VNWVLVTIRNRMALPAAGTTINSRCARFPEIPAHLQTPDFAGFGYIRENGEGHHSPARTPIMLNLTQRLILGCVLLACLTCGLVRLPA
jgi:hypothetical protein